MHGFLAFLSCSQFYISFSVEGNKEIGIVLAMVSSILAKLQFAPLKFGLILILLPKVSKFEFVPLMLDSI